DYDAMPDIDVVADGIEASLAELLAAARGRRAAPASERAAPNVNGAANAAASGNARPAPIVPPDHGRPKRGPAADMRAKRERGSSPSRRRTQD
ncbi:MAG: hypothetical protein ACXVSE_12190, partial [Solirubrobacteraceae bacterium]